MHYGTIRLALSVHGQKSLSVVARMALLDIRFIDYQHACIGTVETTLNDGTMFVTPFSNFNMALSNPQLFTALKVQLQITGAPQVANSIVATLHYKMVYRVQNYAIALSLPASEEALTISVDNNYTSCVHVPRQISTEELVKLLPKTWVTNYVKLHRDVHPVQSTEPKFTKKEERW